MTPTSVPLHRSVLTAHIGLATAIPRGDQEADDEDPTDEVVVGEDTYKDVHVAVVLTGLGVLLASTTFPTTAAGYRTPVLGPRLSRTSWKLRRQSSARCL